MIHQPDVKTKSDAELLQIWRDQIDYREDVIAWVKNEIAHRQLNTAALHIDTPEEKIQSATVSRSSNTCKIVGAFQGFFGLIAISFGFVLISKAISDPRDALFIGIFSVIVFVIGALLLAIAVGISKQRIWAVTAALILWSIVAVLNFFGLLVSKAPGRSLLSVISSLVLIWVLYKILKRLSPPEIPTVPPHSEKTLPPPLPQTPA